MKDDARKALVKAGRELLSAMSLTELSVRKIVGHAGVNLGLYHYYFKNKETYAQAVMNDLVEDYTRNEAEIAIGAKTPLEKLKTVMITETKFIRDHWVFLYPLLYDVARGNRAVKKILLTNFYKRSPTIMAEIRRCKARGMMAGTSEREALELLVGSVVGPCVMYKLLEPLLQGTKERIHIEGILLNREVLSDKSIRQRVDRTLALLLEEQKKSKAKR